MAKGAYIGVNGAAQKVKKMYIGIQGAARKIKKAYVGVNGAARPCWTGGELAYYGTVAELPEDKAYGAAASNGIYALFGGGSNESNVTSTVYAYDANLTQSAPYGLMMARQYLSATRVGDKVIFFGGRNVGSTNYRHADAYDTSLTRTLANNSSDTARAFVGAASVGNYAIFAGGQSSSNLKKVSAYDASLTYKSMDDLSAARNGMVGVSLGDYAIFVGGAPTSTGKETVVYDASLTKIAVSNLSAGRANHAGTSVGKYAVFTGDSATTDVYDTSLTLSTLDVGLGETYISATNLDGYAIFAGDNTDDDVVTNVAYDESLTVTYPSGIDIPRSHMQAASVGNYAIFAGGYYFYSTYREAYVYTVQ